MPYYTPVYGGYGTFLVDNIYFILLIPVFLLSLWAQFQVSGHLSTVSGRRKPTYVGFKNRKTE